MKTLKERAYEFFKSLQNTISTKIERVDGKECFHEDDWVRSPSGEGRTRILQNGAIFEKTGVNFSAVTSQINEKLASSLDVMPQRIFATGISLVLFVERRKNEPWAEHEKEWQLVRRGRYVKFNLIYDRDTLFGLETQGRTESILISLPPEVKWMYNYTPEPGSREVQLLDVLKKTREWG